MAELDQIKPLVRWLSVGKLVFWRDCCRGSVADLTLVNVHISDLTVDFKLTANRIVPRHIRLQEV